MIFIKPLKKYFKLFPANIWIFKFFFLVVFAIKMLLDNTYALLNLLEFKCNHFNSLFLTESESKYSNVGGKQLELMSSHQFSGNAAFTHFTHWIICLCDLTLNFYIWLFLKANVCFKDEWEGLYTGEILHKVSVLFMKKKSPCWIQCIVPFKLLSKNGP